MNQLCRDLTLGWGFQHGGKTFDFDSDLRVDPDFRGKKQLNSSSKMSRKSFNNGAVQLAVPFSTFHDHNPIKIHLPQTFFAVLGTLHRGKTQHFWTLQTFGPPAPVGKAWCCRFWGRWSHRRGKRGIRKNALEPPWKSWDQPQMGIGMGFFWWTNGRYSPPNMYIIFVSIGFYRSRNTK